MLGFCVSGFQGFENGVEFVESAFPELAILFEPCGDLREWLGLQATRAPLAVAAGDHQARALEHFEVLGDGRLAHVKGAGQLGDGGVARGKAREDGTARRVSECGEDGVELGC